MALRFSDHGITNVGSCWLKSLTGFKLCTTTSNNMQQGVQTNATCNIQQSVGYATPKGTKYQRCIQIHKFTFKIDTININLLFECVKIVKFNFNSHVFLIMYQKTRFLNQGACFLNQEERRQFLISSVSERDWKRVHRLEFKMASNRFYIPSAIEFFEGLLSLLQQCGDCVNENPDVGARRISCKTSRGISTHFAGDIWSGYGVGPGESTYSGFGTFNSGALAREARLRSTMGKKMW